MRPLLLAVIASALPGFAFGCTREYEVRDARHETNETQSETGWLRREVQSLRASLAERDRREAEMWRAYVDLAQRIGTLQLARDGGKPAEPTAAVTTSEVIGRPECTPPATTTEAPPRKSVSRAINQSRLTVREKRQLLQSMRPPRVIDIVNPWAADK